MERYYVLMAIHSRIWTALIARRSLLVLSQNQCPCNVHLILQVTALQVHVFPRLLWPCLSRACQISWYEWAPWNKTGWILDSFSRDLNQEYLTCHLGTITAQAFRHFNTILTVHLSLFCAAWTVPMYFGRLGFWYQSIPWSICLNKLWKFRVLVIFSLMRYKYSCYLLNFRGKVQIHEVWVTLCWVSHLSKSSCYSCVSAHDI